jgi:hypothetical protein
MFLLSKRTSRTWRRTSDVKSCPTLFLKNKNKKTRKAEWRKGKGNPCMHSSIARYSTKPLISPKASQRFPSVFGASLTYMIGEVVLH